MPRLKSGLLFMAGAFVSRQRAAAATGLDFAGSGIDGTDESALWVNSSSSLNAWYGWVTAGWPSFEALATQRRVVEVSNSTLCRFDFIATGRSISLRGAVGVEAAVGFLDALDEFFIAVAG